MGWFLSAAIRRCDFFANLLFFHKLHGFLGRFPDFFFARVASDLL
jgi:hypothetical protein